ncbi:MAG: hypothetical protein ACLFUT_12530, partial [Desulfobacteraceae bacterium]
RPRRGHGSGTLEIHRPGQAGTGLDSGSSCAQRKVGAGPLENGAQGKARRRLGPGALEPQGKMDPGALAVIRGF